VLLPNPQFSLSFSSPLMQDRENRALAGREHVVKSALIRSVRSRLGSEQRSLSEVRYASLWANWAQESAHKEADWSSDKSQGSIDLWTRVLQRTVFVKRAYISRESERSMFPQPKTFWYLCEVCCQYRGIAGKEANSRRHLLGLHI
jgi:hypothetical protein